MALEYKNFNLDNENEKEIFRDLLAKLEPQDIIEVKMFERLGFGRSHTIEAHIIFNGDYSKEQLNKKKVSE